MLSLRMIDRYHTVLTEDKLGMDKILIVRAYTLERDGLETVVPSVLWHILTD